MKVELPKSADGTLIPTITPPPIAHIATVEYGGNWFSLCISSGQVQQIAKHLQPFWIDGFSHGLGRWWMMPVRVEILVYDEAVDVTEAYARKFVATNPYLKPI
jgi:hypothetical protein